MPCPERMVNKSYTPGQSADKIMENLWEWVSGFQTGFIPTWTK
jgi:hypothetical protein